MEYFRFGTISPGRLTSLIASRGPNDSSLVLARTWWPDQPDQSKTDAKKCLLRGCSLSNSEQKDSYRQKLHCQPALQIRFPRKMSLLKLARHGQNQRVKTQLRTCRKLLQWRVDLFILQFRSFIAWWCPNNSCLVLARKWWPDQSKTNVPPHELS